MNDNEPWHLPTPRQNVRDSIRLSNKKELRRTALCAAIELQEEIRKRTSRIDPDRFQNGVAEKICTILRHLQPTAEIEETENSAFEEIGMLAPMYAQEAIQRINRFQPVENNNLKVG